MNDYGKGTYKHMLAVAKKKPRVQDALDSVSEMTEDDIDNLKDIPGWIKKQLKKLQKETQKREAGYLTPEEIAAIMISKSENI